MKKSKMLLAMLLILAAPALAQEPEKKEAVKKQPPSACEKCVRDAMRGLQQCESIAKKNDQRETCLKGYDTAAQGCDEGACKPAK